MGKIVKKKKKRKVKRKPPPKPDPKRSRIKPHERDNGSYFLWL